MWCGVQLRVPRLVWVYSGCRIVSGVYHVQVHLGYCGVGVVVLWSVELCFGVLKFVYFYGSSVGVEIVDFKGFELL